jgi:hypothetical protein
MVSPAIACVDPAHERSGKVGSTIKRVELERHVLTAITDQLLAPKAISRLVARDHAEVDGRQSDRKRDTAVVYRRIAKAEKATKRLVAAIADGAIDVGEIREALAAQRANAILCCATGRRSGLRR